MTTVGLRTRAWPLSVIALLLALSGTTASAQQTFSPTPVWTFPEENTESVALGDVDGDGDLDLVRANIAQRATLYLNTGGAFGDTPAWMSSSAWIAQTAVLGDVDGDGDLDLVLGNSLGQGAVLYLNIGGTFASTPAWMAPGQNTTSVALGDVDGDGDLDLVLGNVGDFGQAAAAKLYLNIGATFVETPDWTGPEEATQSIALGDVDGDGDLDLVRGNNDGSVLGQVATLYLNTGGTFASTSAWAGLPEHTTSVALGDVDGDGDLDLVRGGKATTLYLNAGGTFASTPAWTGLAENTTSVALGDVDGDGDLDLVCGNAGGGTTLYLNTGGTFTSTPVWTGPVEQTFSVALGDVDGDGDLDLVRGGKPTTLYPNAGGTFADTAAWTGPAENTTSVALGDVDGDGDVDLVRGGEPTTLYLNAGGTFADTAAWTGLAENTTSVALGDVDGDGDLDLVRGNDTYRATLYLNTGGTFAATPTWRGPGYTRAVALGDVDGDADLDLVRGGPYTTLYLNTGGTFATPVWTGPVESTRSVALGDVDGDGDLDLVRGNDDVFGQAASATLYLNTGGAFAPSPVWTGPMEHTSSVALGDVDGDGHLDLVRGNRNQGATYYRSKSPWHLDSGAPGRQLPNNAAYFQSLRVARAGPNRYLLSVTAFDNESDPVWVVGEYQLEGSSSWQPMILNGYRLRTGPFTTSVAGLPHMLDWDVTALPFDRRNVVVRLRAVSPPRRVGLVQFQPTCMEVVGRVTPTRPALSTPSSGLDFGTLTVGDSRRVQLGLSNQGNLNLVVSRIDAPRDVVIPAVVGLVIPPGHSDSVAVVLSPNAQIATLGPLVVHSNDTLDSLFQIPLVADVRPLAIQSRVVAAAAQLPLGEAATVVVTPGPQVHVESGWVFFRPRGAATFADSSSIFPSGTNFAALIPGRAVTEAGLDYYVRVKNGGVRATDPARAPDSTIFQSVAAPVGVASAARTDLSGEFPVGRPTPVVVSLPVGSVFERGALHFRLVGSAVYDSVGLNATTEIAPGLFAPTDTIPADAMGPRGVEYWVSVNTLTRQLTDPPLDPQAHSHLLRTTVSSLVEPASHAGGHYRMVSVPLELNAGSSSLEDLLSGQPEFGAYDPTRWRSFRWDPADSSYLEISPANAATGKLRPEPGRAFWLIAKEANHIDTAPVPGRSPLPTSITLERGWNQVSDPYDFPVAWSDVTASDVSGATVGSLKPPVAWDEAAGSYDTTDVSVLLPFEGYWIKNPTSGPVTLQIPPVEAVAPPGSSPAAPEAGAPADSLAWSIQTSAQCGTASSDFIRAGVATVARDGDDPLDRSQPPMAPGDGTALYLVRGQPFDRLRADVRPSIPESGEPQARGRQWLFDLARTGADVEPVEVTLTFTDLDRVPADVELRLVDRTLDRVVDLRRESTYRYVSGARGYVASEAEARFALIAGSTAYVEAARNGLPGPPVRTQLLAPYPNPVAGTSLVRFEVARPGRVTLEVFDFAGRRVRTLADGAREAGRFELVWSGDNSTGQRLAPGVYLLRLSGPDRVDARKAVLVR